VLPPGMLTLPVGREVSITSPGVIGVSLTAYLQRNDAPAHDIMF